MNKSNLIRIALVQMSCSEDTDKNILNAESYIKEASENSAKIICLPELFKYRYFCQSEDTNKFDLAEPIPGSTTQEFSKLAKKLKIVIVVPLFERRASGIYHNSLVVIDADGEIAGTYRKMHIPDDPGYYEKYYFIPGDDGFKSFDTRYGKIGTLICWDQWFPEAARIVSLGGANVIFYPSAIGWHPSEKEEFGKKQLDSWIIVQRGHAIANGVYIAVVNRVGFENSHGRDDGKGIEFWGSSFICGPQGEIVSQSSINKEEIIYADIDTDKIESVRRNWPFLRDRRIDLYSDIKKRFL